MHPLLYLHVWKMSFIKGRCLEFQAHNYDRAKKMCALVGRFTQMGSVKSDDDAHPVFSKPILWYSNITWQILRACVCVCVCVCGGGGGGVG